MGRCARKSRRKWWGGRAAVGWLQTPPPQTPSCPTPLLSSWPLIAAVKIALQVSMQQRCTSWRTLDTNPTGNPLALCTVFCNHNEYSIGSIPDEHSLFSEFPDCMPALPTVLLTPLLAEARREKRRGYTPYSQESANQASSGGDQSHTQAGTVN